MLALNEAMEKLTQEMPRLADVVECRFFGGYGEEDTARALGFLAHGTARPAQSPRMVVSRTGRDGLVAGISAPNGSCLRTRRFEAPGGWLSLDLSRSNYRELIWPPN